MDLRHLIDRVLLQDTKILAGREREIMSQVLHHLREIDRRKLFADLGYSSLFSYCTDELKYSPDQAQRRISACRMLAELPEIEKKLDDGSLNLTVLGMANSFFKEKNFKTEEKRALIQQIEGKSKKEVEIILAPEQSPALANVAQRKVSKTQTKVTLILEDVVVEKLKELQALFSHSKKRDLPELIDFLCTQELEKQKSAGMPILPAQAARRVEGQEARQQQKSLQTVRTTKVAKVAGRTIFSGVKKEVWSKAKGRCQKAGCCSKHFLQLHHIVPYSEGGANTAENLKLLCHAHHCRGHFA